MVWPSSSCSRYERAPCRTPTSPAVIVAACRPVSNAVAAGLEADQPHVGVVEERGEQPDRVGSAADAGDRGVGQRAGELEAPAPAPRRRCRGSGRAPSIGNGCGPAAVPNR